MLRLALISSLAAASASAQPPAAPTDSHQTLTEAGVPTTGERVLLVVGAGGGALVTLWTGPGALLGAGLGTYATSAALGLRPTVGGALLDTAVGTGVAVGVYWVTILAVVEVGGAPHALGTDLGSAALGLAAGAAAMGWVHGERLARLRSGARVAPVVLRAPTGERTPGLSLRVGL